jgi:hypothetical protein
MQDRDDFHRSGIIAEEDHVIFARKAAEIAVQFRTCPTEPPRERRQSMALPAKSRNESLRGGEAATHFRDVDEDIDGVCSREGEEPNLAHSP